MVGRSGCGCDGAAGGSLRCELSGFAGAGHTNPHGDGTTEDEMHAHSRARTHRGGTRDVGGPGQCRHLCLDVPLQVSKTFPLEEMF